MIAVGKAGWLPPLWLYLTRFAAIVLILLFYRPRIPWRASHAFASVWMGAAVFAVWIAPDLLFGPGYRASYLFDNAVTGQAVSSIPTGLQGDFWFVVLRAASSTLLVPVVEELFWRGWMMRWMIDANFQKVPLGAYTWAAFWSVAVLFASEHGPYWDVGLVAGILYNWWIVRTRSLSDCILAHAVTNGLLSVYVILSGHWQYWL